MRNGDNDIRVSIPDCGMHRSIVLAGDGWYVCTVGAQSTSDEVSYIEVQDCVVSARVTVTAPFAYRAEN